jgi:DNA-binding NarL/FixJ family response regulator
MNYGEQLSVGLGTCSKCGKVFSRFGRENKCIECKKKKPKQIILEGTSLTNREKQIIRLITQAKSNKVIAGELELSEGTVKEYMHHIFRKLKVSSRTELAVKTIKNPSNLP